MNFTITAVFIAFFIGIPQLIALRMGYAIREQLEKSKWGDAILSSISYSFAFWINLIPNTITTIKDRKYQLTSASKPFVYDPNYKFKRN